MLKTNGRTFLIRKKNDEKSIDKNEIVFLDGVHFHIFKHHKRARPILGGKITGNLEHH